MEQYTVRQGASGRIGGTPPSPSGPTTPWRTVVHDGGWYCDALPSGEFVVLFPESRYLKTHQGVVEFYGNSPTSRTTTYAPLFPRITTIGGYKIIGQAWDAPETVEYVEGQWHLIPQTASGNNPVIYDAFGIPHISDGSYPGPGSQGYAYVDRYTYEVVYADATRTSGPSIGIPLYEYVDLGDGIYVGLGSVSLDGSEQNTGVACWDANTQTYRILEEGVCRSVRAHRDEYDRVSVAMYRQTTPPVAVLKFGTLDGMLSLPSRAVV